MKKRITLKDALARIAELEREVRELKARPAQEVHHHHHYAPAMPVFPTIPPITAPAPFAWPWKVWCGKTAAFPTVSN